MKKVVCFLTVLLLVSYGSLSVGASVTSVYTSADDSIRVVCAPELLSLTEKWAAEYKKINPEVKIRVVQATGELSASNLFRSGAIGFVPDNYLSAVNDESAWKVVVGRDVVVPIMNANNPYLNEINRNGISAGSLRMFLTGPGADTWGTLLGGSQTEKAVFYLINDISIKDNLTGFLNMSVPVTGGIIVGNGDELIAAIQKNPLAIGFCTMANILDPEKQTFAENIRLIPVDRNNNGTLDYSEKIYEDFASFSRGIWIGKYPRSLVTNIYSVSSSQPTGEKETAFLKWVLSDGQKYLGSNGYSDLLVAERQTAAERLNSPEMVTLKSSDDNSPLKAALMILALIIITGFIADASFSYSRRKSLVRNTAGSPPRTFPAESAIEVPAGLYFDKTHTWAFMESNGIVTVGIDDFLQHITGPISRIKMKGEGKNIKKGEVILSVIQNGKQLNLYAPVSGTIMEQNVRLKDDSSLINNSPYGEGWVYKIEPTNWIRENQLLFMADKQRQFLKKEFSRLKDFLALALQGPEGKLIPVMLQDGGEIRDGVLADLGPEVWEDFQTNFIDPSRQIWFYEMF
jgi:glycine cleavage system H lipoate-binding protein/ABC-type phosphate transport system substrate-binding protein